MTATDQVTPGEWQLSPARISPIHKCMRVKYSTAVSLLSWICVKPEPPDAESRSSSQKGLAAEALVLPGCRPRLQELQVNLTFNWSFEPDCKIPEAPGGGVDNQDREIKWGL
ncbi:uncharacterized protein LOC144061707 [Vanacampus margaritifer]